MSTPEVIAKNLPPLWVSYLCDMATRGRTLTNDGGMADTILSSMCSGENILAKWEMNSDGERCWDGSLKYISKYTPTELGRAVADILLQGVGQRFP